MEAPLEGNVIYLRNLDVPGVVGRVGTVLGQHNVNIANFSLGRGPEGQETSAVAVVQVDGEISEAVLGALALHRDHPSGQGDSLWRAAAEESGSRAVRKAHRGWRGFSRVSSASNPRHSRASAVEFLSTNKAAPDRYGAAKSKMTVEPLMCGGNLSGPRGDCETNLGAAQRVEHGVVVEIGGGLLQRFFGARLGFLRALHVDVFGALRGVGQDRHLVRQHFGEAPRDREIVRVGHLDDS